VENRREVSRRYYLKHRDIILAKQKSDHGKELKSRAQKAYYERNKTKILSDPRRKDWDKRSYLKHREKRLADNKVYRSTESGKESRRREYADPIKVKARQKLNDGIQAGKIKRKPCEVCGNPVSEGHHDSYDKEHWYIVKWFCKKHHVEYHKTLSSSAHLEGTKGENNEFDKLPLGD
jgi:hypothetical protein